MNANIQPRMELLRRYSKVLKFVFIKDDVIYAYLFCNIFSIQNELLDISWPIKETFGKNTSIIDSVHCIIKTV
jgi:hypothetical protein